MKYVVMNRTNAKRYSFESHMDKSIIISITDVDKDKVRFQHNPVNKIVAVKHLMFDDVEQGEMNCITDEDAVTIVNFVEYWKNKCDLIIVQCEAGQSRSAGVCAAIMKAFEGDDWQIFNNPKYVPNMTCYWKVLNVFQCEIKTIQKKEQTIIENKL